MKSDDPSLFPPFPPNRNFSPTDHRFSDNGVPLTPETAEIASIILEQLAAFPEPQGRCLLLSGDPGVDRCRLLRYLQRALSDPGHPSWRALLRCLNLGDEVRPRAPIQSLFIQIPPDPSENLTGFFANSFEQHAPGDNAFPRTGELAPDRFSAGLERISRRLAEESIGMVVLQDVSERIEQSKDTAKVQEEFRLYRIISDIFAQSGILTVFIGKEKHLNPADPAVSLLAGDEEYARNYVWIETAIPPVIHQSAFGQEEEFHQHLQMWIYDWIRSEIPAWQPERSPRYRKDSQALAAGLPEGEKQPAGLVYFKSTRDPYWSDEDIERLSGSEYSWILMVLNPCERFYEFEERLQQIGSCLPKLAIWRPDAPTKAETDALRSLLPAAAGPAGEQEPLEGERALKMRALLSDLYIRRGRFMNASDPHIVGTRIKNQGIRRHLSVYLNRLSLQKGKGATQKKEAPPETDRYSQAMQTAALLAGDPELQNSSAAYARERLLDWWANSVDDSFKKLPAFPEAFRTTRFWSEIKQIEGPALSLKSVFQSLHLGETSLYEAMDRIEHNFGRNRERLLQWKQKVENLRGLSLWMPAFVHECEYLNASFPLDQGNLASLRESLLQSFDLPHRFFEAKARNEFDEKFLAYKKSYIEAYYLLHEDAVHAMSGSQRYDFKIDPVMLRNLDLLSRLQYANKSYLNRVKLLAKWIQYNQCTLPLRQILELYPRCYCNFNPCSSQQPSGTAAQINSIIQEGIAYFRTILRRCEQLIMEELNFLQVDDRCLEEIAAAIGDGAMIPLKPQSINILNRIIIKYPNEFLAEIRKGTGLNQASR
jgi:hypothetical protein